MTDKDKISVSAVLVTFNRLSDLKKALQCYLDQTEKPDFLIVVNNASSDGTKEYLDDFVKSPLPFPVTVLDMESNLGGAGGFAAGAEEALKYKTDFIFMADDDAFPRKTMFEELYKYYRTCDCREEISALCTSVIDQYGYSNIHRGRLKKGLISIGRARIYPDEYERNETLDVDFLTFVGAMVKRSVVEKIGLPLAEYFIHEDDAEYSTRIRKEGIIRCVISSEIEHEDKGLHSNNWVEFYQTRNYIDYIRRHYPRRYYRYAIADKYIKKCSVVAAVVKKRSGEFRAMCRYAIQEAKKGNLGINERYKPGTPVK